MQISSHSPSIFKSVSNSTETSIKDSLPNEDKSVTNTVDKSLLRKSRSFESLSHFAQDKLNVILSDETKISEKNPENSPSILRKKEVNDLIIDPELKNLSDDRPSLKAAIRSKRVHSVLYLSPSNASKDPFIPLISPKENFPGSIKGKEKEEIYSKSDNDKRGKNEEASTHLITESNIPIIKKKSLLTQLVSKFSPKLTTKKPSQERESLSIFKAEEKPKLKEKSISFYGFKQTDPFTQVEKNKENLEPQIIVKKLKETLKAAKLRTPRVEKTYSHKPELTLKHHSSNLADYKYESLFKLIFIRLQTYKDFLEGLKEEGHNNCFINELYRKLNTLLNPVKDQIKLDNEQTLIQQFLKNYYQFIQLSKSPYAIWINYLVDLAIGGKKNKNVIKVLDQLKLNSSKDLSSKGFVKPYSLIVNEEAEYKFNNNLFNALSKILEKNKSILIPSKKLYGVSLSAALELCCQFFEPDSSAKDITLGEILALDEIHLNAVLKVMKSQNSCLLAPVISRLKELKLAFHIYIEPFEQISRLAKELEKVLDNLTMAEKYLGKAYKNDKDDTFIDHLGPFLKMIDISIKDENQLPDIIKLIYLTLTKKEKNSVKRIRTQAFKESFEHNDALEVLYYWDQLQAKDLKNDLGLVVCSLTSKKQVCSYPYQWNFKVLDEKEPRPVIKMEDVIRTLFCTNAKASDRKSNLTEVNLSKIIFNRCEIFRGGLNGSELECQRAFLTRFLSLVNYGVQSLQEQENEFSKKIIEKGNQGHSGAFCSKLSADQILKQVEDLMNFQSIPTSLALWFGSISWEIFSLRFFKYLFPDFFKEFALNYLQGTEFALSVRHGKSYSGTQIKHVQICPKINPEDSTSGWDKDKPIAEFTQEWIGVPNYSLDALEEQIPAFEGFLLIKNLRPMKDANPQIIFKICQMLKISPYMIDYIMA